MAKKPPKIPKKDRQHNREMAKPGQRVRFALGRNQTEYIGKIIGPEDPFVLVNVPGLDHAKRVWPTACFPIDDDGNPV